MSSELHALLTSVAEHAARLEAEAARAIALLAQPPATETLDVNEVVAARADLLRGALGDVQVDVRLTPNVGSVRADRSQLEQTLTRLVANAHDASPAGGVITIETALAVFSPEDAAAWNTSEGAHVLVRVGHDGTNGDGIELAAIAGGAAWVEPDPVRLTVSLPLADSPGATAPSEKHDTVLLLEDEQVVRSLVREILEHEGFNVLEATTPEEAFVLAAQNPNGIDVLLTDVVMPGMNGPQIAAEIVGEWPELKVLYMSGYTDEAVVRHGVSDGTTAFLQKPFTAAELAGKVRSVLAE